MKISSLLLVLLAQFSGCASSLCSLSLEDEFGSRHLSITIPFVEDIALLSQDDFLVVARPTAAPAALEITRVRANHEEMIASTPPLYLSDPRPPLFTSGERWWFSRQGDEGLFSSVFFVMNGEQIHQARVKLPRRYPLLWLPIRGDEPRGVEISVAQEQPALQIDVVTPSSVTPMGAFVWWQTDVHFQTLQSSRWSAEALGHGRIAVVAVDGPPEHMTLRLRILGDEDPVESAIPCAVPIDYPLATAVDASGRLAVVGTTKEGKVVAMIVNVDQPQSSSCRVISAPGEVAAKPLFGPPSVVWDGEDFIAAWIRDDGTVRACELGNLRVPPLITDVGEGADANGPLRQLIHADSEQVTFIWKERGGGFVVRRMPKSLTGYAFAAELWRLLCAAFEKANGKADKAGRMRTGPLVRAPAPASTSAPSAGS